ncbi:MAG: hypothetical protein NC127_08330 [Muribaculum sp.]|nr:hypothetical protein [Muribaculum sp.]
METRRNERKPTHSFAPCGANQHKSGATAIRKNIYNGAGNKDSELLKQQEKELRRIRRNLLQLSATRCSDHSHHLTMRSAAVPDSLQTPLTALSYSNNVSQSDNNAQPSCLSEVLHGGCIIDNTSDIYGGK